MTMGPRAIEDFADRIVSATKRHPYLVYTILFLIMLPLVFMVSIQTSRGLMWSADGVTQHFNALLYFGRWLRKLGLSILAGDPEATLFDFTVGYGSNVIGTFGYYMMGDPLAFISAIVPTRYTEALYNILVVVRMYLGGVAFMAFCRKMEKPALGVLAASLAYAFSAWYLIAATAHPFFGNPPIYFPLLLLGFEKVLRKENPLLFMAAVALSAASNFYFFYMLVIGLFVYAVARFFTYKMPHDIRSFMQLLLRCLLYGATGVFLSCVILLPVLILFFESSRSGSTLAFNPVYTADYYHTLAGAFTSSYYETRYSLVALSAPVLLGVVMLFAAKQKHRALKAVLLICVVVLLLPKLGSAMNGFSYPTNRWSFMYAFLIAYIFATMWDEVIDAPTHLEAILVACVAYVTLLFMCQQKASPAMASVVLVLLTVLILSIVSKKAADAPEHMRTALSSLVVVILVCVGLVGDAYFRTSQDWKDDTSSFNEYGIALDNMRDTTAAKVGGIQKGDPTFGRLDEESYRIKNTSINTGAYTTQYFWSLASGVIPEYLYDLGTTHVEMSDNYWKLESRSSLEALASVEYYVGPEDRVPYGFVEDSELSTDDMTVWHNQHQMPLGFTFDSYMDRSQWLNLSLSKRQDALLQTAIVNDSDVPLVEDLAHIASLEDNTQNIPFEYELDGQYVKTGEREILVGPDGATLSLAFEGEPDCETYVQMYGLIMEPKTELELYMDEYDEFYTEDEFNALEDMDRDEIIEEGSMLGHNPVGRVYITVDTGSSEMSMPYTTEYYTYRNVVTNYLVHLGYSSEPLGYAAFELPGPAVYSIGELNVVAHHLDTYEGYIDDRTNCALENVKIDTNVVSGDIAMTDDGLLFFSIPYDRGWSAYVDGEKADLLQTDIMYMSVPLRKGHHDIELRYLTPGLLPGFACTVIGVFAAIGLTLRWRRQKSAPFYDAAKQRRRTHVHRRNA